MNDKIFLVSREGTEYSYDRLLEDIRTQSVCSEISLTSDMYEIFVNIVIAILVHQDLLLLDTDFSHAEIKALGVKIEDLENKRYIPNIKVSSVPELLAKICASQSWELSLFTSGTTGLPKKVTHRLSALTRMARISDGHLGDVWGFAYNPTHIAGIQVFFQALLNGNTIIDIFGLPQKEILERIEKYQITNISATPTFYRLLMPIEGNYPSVKRITSGGEKFDSKLTESLLRAFNNAQLRNIYASTEAGTLLESKNDVFKITDHAHAKIVGNRLYVHTSFLGTLNRATEWYDTGDLVEFTDIEKHEFKFIGRDNEMINVGGYKANPTEIEEVICSHPDVIQAKIWGKTNSVVGNILVAEVVCRQLLDESKLREYLRPLLQDYKIPRIINITDKIATTRSGKVKRN